METIKYDAAKNQQIKNLWQDQIDALKIIEAEPNVDAIPILILFLDYNVDINWNLSTGLRRKSLQKSCEQWPAFGAIIKTPGAAPILTTYILDFRNPLDMRGAVFQILRYVDKGAFIKVSPDFEKALSGTNATNRKYLQGVESGDIPFFNGIYWYTAMDPHLLRK